MSTVANQIAVFAINSELISTNSYLWRNYKSIYSLFFLSVKQFERNFRFTLIIYTFKLCNVCDLRVELDLPRKNFVKQFVCLLFFLQKLFSSIFHQLFQVVCMPFNQVDHVIHDVYISEKAPISSH